MGLRAYHVFLSIVVIIIALDVVLVFQTNRFIDRALETEGRVIALGKRPQILQYVDPRTGRVYAKPIYGSVRVREEGISIQGTRVVDVLYDPVYPENFYLKHWDLWQIPKFSIYPMGFFLFLSAFLRAQYSKEIPDL